MAVDYSCPVQGTCLYGYGYGFQGLLANGTFSALGATTILLN